MNPIERIAQKAEKAAQLVAYDVQYIPGVTEDLDQYQAINEDLGVSSYGPTQEKALERARIQAKSELMENSAKLDEILASGRKNVA